MWVAHGDRAIIKGEDGSLEMVRPARVPPKSAFRIIDAISGGSSLVTACKRYCVPLEKFRRWIRTYPQLEPALEEARRSLAEYCAYGALEIADDLSIETSRAKLMVDTRITLSERLMPHLFGKREKQEVTVTIGIAEQIQNGFNRLHGREQEKAGSPEKAIDGEFTESDEDDDTETGGDASDTDGDDEDGDNDDRA